MHSSFAPPQFVYRCSAGRNDVALEVDRAVEVEVVGRHSWLDVLRRAHEALAGWKLGVANTAHAKRSLFVAAKRVAPMTMVVAIRMVVASE